MERELVKNNVKQYHKARPERRYQKGRPISPEGRRERLGYRIPILLHNRLKRYWKRYKSLVRYKAQVVTYALEYFMQEHDSPEKLKSFLDAREERLGRQKTIK